MFACAEGKLNFATCVAFPHVNSELGCLTRLVSSRMFANVHIENDSKHLQMYWDYKHFSWKKRAKGVRRGWNVEAKIEIEI